MHPIQPSQNLLNLTANYNAVAKTYTKQAALAKEIGTRLLDRLQLIRIKPEVILDLGAGSSIHSKTLEQHYKPAKLLVVDIALNLLKQGKKQRRWRSRQHFIAANAEQLPLANETIDLIFTNLLFYHFDHLPLLLQEIYRALKPGGLLLFSSFGPDTLKELRCCCEQLPSSPQLLTFMDMHEVGDQVMHAHFSDPVLDREELTLTYPNIDALLADFQVLGGTSLINGGIQLSSQTQEGAALAALYEPYRLSSQRLPASFEIVYGHAWKAAAPTSKPSARGEIFIPVKNVQTLSNR